MRILVISDLPAFVTGGAEAQAGRLIEEWLEAGHEVICLGRRMATHALPIGSHTIQVRRIRTVSFLGRAGRAASYFLSLAWLLLRYRRWADIVYTRFMGEAAATAALLKCSGLLNIPLIATPASSSKGGDIQHIMSVPFASSVIKLLDRHCDAINLIAPSLNDELCEFGFSGRNFTRISNGIRLRPVTHKRLDASLRIVSVGRLSHQKGFDVLLRALSRVTIPPGVSLQIIGDGPEMPALSRLANDLGLANAVEWLGELPTSGVMRRLEESDLFVLASRYEGLSNAGLEAMERGLPLIITKCGGLDTYVGPDIGWVVPVDDELAFAAAIDAVINAGAERLGAMGQAARVCVERNFDIKETSRRHVELFEALRRSRTGGVPLD